MRTSACSCSASSKHMGSDLVAQATTARERAIATHSGFKVGAALETSDGRVFTGCNIENVSYGLTMCAERVALFKALSDGARDFKTLVILTDTANVTPPCCACRQLLWEFCGNIDVRMHSLRGTDQTLKMSDLLPRPFDKL